MEAVRAAVDLVLAAYEPYPAVVVDRGWHLVSGNSSIALLTDGVAPELLEPPVNVLRLGLHPEGWRRASSTCRSGGRICSPGWPARHT